MIPQGHVCIYSPCLLVFVGYSLNRAAEITLFVQISLLTSTLNDSVIIPTQITSTEKMQGVPAVRAAWFVSQLLWQSQALHPQNAHFFFSSAKGVKPEGQGAPWFILILGWSGNNPCFCISGTCRDVVLMTGL